MTHIKYPNELGPPVPYHPNWQNEAMRQNALLHSAMTGGAEAEARAAKFELERDALLRVVTDNHVALQRAEDAEAKLAKAVAALRQMMEDAEYPDAVWETGEAVLAELEKTE
jgi:hypothetical protein